MKIIYYSNLSVSDSDFPLIREFQRNGLDVVAYFPIAEWNKGMGLVNIKRMLKKDCIIRASDVDELNIFSSYINLSCIYLINQYHYKRYQWQNWVLWFKTVLHMYRQHASIIHFIWPPARQEKLLYLLPLKRVLTVHDPFPHSSGLRAVSENNRKMAFSMCQRFILLNEAMRKDFLIKYNLPESIVIQNKMGEFDFLKLLSSPKSTEEKTTILYFGQIQSHKGIEYLMEAMTCVHSRYPNIKLIVAGKGAFYFDIEPYLELDYIEIRNRYIPIEELAELLGNSIFVVCPYKDATQSGVVQMAFSACVPLIVTNTGNMADVVKHLTYGLVVPPCDSNALSKAMVYLLDNPQLLESFKANISSQWHEEMSWGPIAKKYIEMYQELDCDK